MLTSFALDFLLTWYIQTGIFIVALVDLCYKIFKEKTAATTSNSDGQPHKG